MIHLASYVSGQTAYQHGENSLFSTIIGLSHNFVRSKGSLEKEMMVVKVHVKKWNY